MIRTIGSADPKYLAATDLLIGDMSNINYEFLLLNRPIVLLANRWIEKNFPDIGGKAHLSNLEDSILTSLNNPQEYSIMRKLWLDKTISEKSESASAKYIDLMIHNSGLKDPIFIFLSGNDSVRKTNLTPLVNEIKKRGLQYQYMHRESKIKFNNKKNLIFVAAHFVDLRPNYPGFKVHIDHDLKGIATANLNYAILDYKRNKYFPHIDLHIVAGEAGEKRTKLVLGPNADRTVIGGYPKGDTILECNTLEIKDQVYSELGLEKGIPLVTYAPAGEKSIMKPGGSLSKKVLSKLDEMSKNGKFHILIKLKYDNSFYFKYKSTMKSLYYFIFGVQDYGDNWRILKSELLNSDLVPKNQAET